MSTKRRYCIVAVGNRHRLHGLMLVQLEHEISTLHSLLQFYQIWINKTYGFLTVHDTE